MLKVELSKFMQDRTHNGREMIRKRVLKMFEDTGQSTHSALSTTLPFIINHCEQTDTAYELRAVPGVGYHIKKLPGVRLRVDLPETKPEKPSIKVGDKFWSFDVNRRRYARRGNANRPIYREHFFPVQVIGETRVSWIIGHPTEGDGHWSNELFKVPKRDPFREKNGEFGSRPMIFTDAGVDDECWMHDHRWRIREYVGRVSDPEKVRKIAEILGYDSADGLCK